MNFLQLAKDRYSCRKLSDRPVEPEKIDRILEAAQAAPTATNAQPYHIWVLQSPEALEKIRTCTSCHFDAKVLMLVGGDEKAAWVRPFDGRNFADVDATIVATQLMLAVQAEGLGTTWVGWFDANRVRELFPETAGYDLVALFPIGYPAADAKPAPRHFERLSRDEAVTTL